MLNLMVGPTFIRVRFGKIHLEGRGGGVGVVWSIYSKRYGYSIGGPTVEFHNPHGMCEWNTKRIWTSNLNYLILHLGCSPFHGIGAWLSMVSSQRSMPTAWIVAPSNDRKQPINGFSTIHVQCRHCGPSNDHKEPINGISLINYGLIG